MFAWGSTVHGELGLGGIEEENIFTPRSLEWFGAKILSEASCGETHSLLLTNDGKVYSCGNNDYGQLGHDQPRKRPQQVTGLDAYHILHVACGVSHSMALNQWGQIFTWGCDLNGQLGHNLGQQVQPTPKILKALATLHVVQIACGQKHSIALTSGGDIYGWGANDCGQLGLGNTTPSEPIPTLVLALSGIPMAQISCGSNHTFAVSKSGAVFGWGKNIYGQLGLNDTTSKSYPTQLRTLRNLKVRFISCGDEFSTFLTLDGGVFSCGAGMYGQLGHGNTSNEILPKKVLELMGSTITQISCGGRHTLALVPSRGRVYGFGLGGSGQLGGNNAVNSSIPQIVQGPWVPASTSGVHSSLSQYIIYRIFAGGDHSFASVTEKVKEVSSYDSRQIEPKMQILCLNYDYLKNCLKVSHGSVDQEALVFLETVFKSLACINGSFLLSNEEHYGCSSKHHGVDMAAAEKTFSLIGKCENSSIKELIFTCITDELLKKLSTSPPDVETLRIYLILPFYHEFNNPKQHASLHRPFAQAALNLQPAAHRVLGLWWSSLCVDHFERLVILFKSVVCFIIQNQKVPKNKTVSYDASLVSALDILKLLHRLNRSLEAPKVSYDTFHLPELADCLDVRVDYLLWLTDPNTSRLFLCNYPFLFDANAKVELLHTDQSIQMQSAMNQAAQRSFIAMLFQPNAVSALNQFLVLNVTRETIVSDTLRELVEVDSADLKKPLKIKFYGEEAEDAGGVRKEFFMLLLRDILDPKYGMFKEYEETRTIWFTENPFEDKVMYLLIGLICGLAIYNFTIIDLPFPLALYKKLLKEPVTLNDLKDLSPTIANSLKSLLDYNDTDFEDVFALNFEITRDIFGEHAVIHLKPNGDKVPVTQENKKEYVDLYVDYIFNKAVNDQFEAFHMGFMKVCGGRVLQLFHSHELMAVVVGNEDYDWHALEESAEYKNGYTSSDKTIRWFWEVIHEMTLQDKKKFLLFLTGCDRIPIQGMKAIQIIIQPTTDDKYLPVAHTCFNLLDLPRYKTKEKLRYKLLQAIQQTQGFSLV